MLYILYNDLLENSLYTVIEKCYLWFYHSYIVQSYCCLIIYSDRKSNNHTINNNNNDDIIVRISVREEDDSRENLSKKENENRENEEDRILSDSLKEAEKEDKNVFINRKICWDNSVSNKLIDKLYKYLLIII